MDTRWLSLVSPLPSLFPLHPFSIAPLQRIPLLPQFTPLIKKDKSKQFLVEQLLPNGAKSTVGIRERRLRHEESAGVQVQLQGRDDGDGDGDSQQPGAVQLPRVWKGE
ncbi:unnamed protein product [Angiostrongylus costaricensis]|uniref:Uncharacterized protein n=1 Tax=Angiostrongylus costaricensis TaxID=334426 RepID=A0A0R3PUD9_ANGCS|nr:unnamed protein product [Angiostrongylus costaricensis]